MKVREGHRLTQSCTESLLFDVTTLCSNMIEDIKAKISRELQHTPMFESINEKITAILEQPVFTTPFAGLETKYKQMLFLRKHFGFVVRLQHRMYY